MSTNLGSHMPFGLHFAVVLFKFRNILVIFCSVLPFRAQIHSKMDLQNLVRRPKSVIHMPLLALFLMWQLRHQSNKLASDLGPFCPQLGSNLGPIGAK